MCYKTKKAAEDSERGVLKGPVSKEEKDAIERYVVVENSCPEGTTRFGQGFWDTLSDRMRRSVKQIHNTYMYLVKSKKKANSKS